MSTTSEPVPPLVQKGSHCDLLTWKDPARTGKVFGGLLLTLIVFKTVNLFNIFFRLAYMALLVSAAAEYAGKLVTGQGFVTKYKPSAKLYANKINQEFLPHLANFNEKFEEEVQKIVYAHDIETTLKGAGISYVLYKVTSLFSLYSLLVTALVLTFTVPAVYVRNKKEIDAAVAQYSRVAREKASEFTAVAQKQAAPYVETLVQKSGPVGAYVKQLLPVRTAGSTVGHEKGAYQEPQVTATPATASTTGASQFPEVPTSSLNKKSGLDEFIEETQAKASQSLH